MTPSLEQLALRVEAATGPDRELDAGIAVAIGGKSVDIHADGDIGWVNFEVGRRPLRSYTGSLDAAMTLKPDEWFISGASEQEDGRFCFALFPRRPDDLGVPRTFEAHSALVARAVAATPALALCAAALRAISTTQGSNNG